VIASIRVTPASIELMNPDQFSNEDQVAIISIVKGALFAGEPRKSRGKGSAIAQPKEPLIGGSVPDEDDGNRDRGVSGVGEPENDPFLGSVVLGDLLHREIR